jgi:hypothetical protein
VKPSMIVGYCTGIVPNGGSGRSPSESRVSLSVMGLEANSTAILSAISSVNQETPPASHR